VKSVNGIGPFRLGRLGRGRDQTIGRLIHDERQAAEVARKRRVASAHLVIVLITDGGATSRARPRRHNDRRLYLSGLLFQELRQRGFDVARLSKG